MEGFLDKKGRGKTVFFVRPWTNRFFSIDIDTKLLNYYAPDKSLKGSVNVTGGAVVDLSEGEKPHMIEVRTVDGEVLSLSAPTAKDKARWLSCLTEYSAKENVQISTSESGDEVP